MAIHLDPLDGQPFTLIFHESRVVGGRVEPLREDPVTLCRYKDDVADLGRACAEPVQFREDGIELLNGGRRHAQACITCIRLELPDLKREDLKLPSHIHDLIEHQGHNTRIDDMPLQFDFPARLHV